MSLSGKLKRHLIFLSVVMLSVLILVVWLNRAALETAYKGYLVRTVQRQVVELLKQAAVYRKSGDKLADVKLRAVVAILPHTFQIVSTPDNSEPSGPLTTGSLRSGSFNNPDSMLSVEMYQVTTGIYPAEYKRAEQLVGEELVNTGPPVLTLLMLRLEGLSRQDELSEIEAAGSCTALRAILMSSRSDGIRLLRRMLHFGKSNVLTWEATILAFRYGLDEIDDDLISQVKRYKGWGRQYSIFVLGKRNVHRSIPAIISALEDHSPAVRRHAAKALLSLGDGSALPALRTGLAKEKDEVARLLMSRAISRIENSLSDFEHTSLADSGR